jgi:hypothetical protein
MIKRSYTGIKLGSKSLVETFKKYAYDKVLDAIETLEILENAGGTYSVYIQNARSQKRIAELTLQLSAYLAGFEDGVENASII